MAESIRTVSKRGQVTLPRHVRDLLGIEPQDRVRFHVDGDRVYVMRCRDNLDHYARSIPALDPPRTWKEIEEIAHDEHAEHAAREGLD